MEKRLKPLSMQLAGPLRHGKKDVVVDEAGWATVKHVLSKITGNWSIDDVRAVVEFNEKKRYALKEENGVLFIRAVQGHSLSHVKIEMKEITSPDLYPEVVHGTYFEVLGAIKEQGLKRIGRNHMHLANGLNAISGMRKSCEVEIYINMKSAMDDGMKFYLSENGVVLTEGFDGVIPPKYFEKIVTR